MEIHIQFQLGTLLVVQLSRGKNIVLNQQRIKWYQYIQWIRYYSYEVNPTNLKMKIIH